MMVKTPHLDIHVGADYLDISVNDHTIHRTMYPSSVDVRHALQIVRACNTHDALIEAFNSILVTLLDDTAHKKGPSTESIAKARLLARAALAKAKGDA